MKKVSGRSVFTLMLTLVLVAGTALFCVRWALSAQKWVSFPGSPYAYNGVSVRGTRVFDRSGRRILSTVGARAYDEDPLVRAATVHLLGDRDGYISAPLLPAYADRMIRYSRITGAEKLTGETNVRLSVSAPLQAAALQALGGRRGTVGVYNYKTGEILCAVTSPSYDPDHVPDISGDTTGAYDGVYVNRFFRSAYTPGSIFKLVTAAAALETLEDAGTRTASCTGRTVIGGQAVVCMGSHGTLTLGPALAHSCNVYFGELSAAVGQEALQALCDRAGLNGTLECDGYACRSRVELSGADEGDLAWAGIGQYTDQVTALQFLRFVGVIAGGGEAAEPYLMQKISREGKTLYEAQTRTTGRILQAQTARDLGAMMRQAVAQIYGDWRFGGLNVCGKTGTAEHEGRTSDAMFAGFVQDEAYPVACVVFIEQGGAGSESAVPVAAEVLNACRRMLDEPNPNDAG